VKEERDNDAVAGALERLKEAAIGEENLVPCLVETVKTYASVGEITEALKEVFGTFKEPLLV
jgi:methylmalonyl-CoA mutase N-terminal domain/subunit